MCQAAVTALRTIPPICAAALTGSIRKSARLKLRNACSAAELAIAAVKLSQQDAVLDASALPGKLSDLRQITMRVEHVLYRGPLIEALVALNGVIEWNDLCVDDVGDR